MFLKELNKFLKPKIGSENDQLLNQVNKFPLYFPIYEEVLSYEKYLRESYNWLKIEIFNRNLIRKKITTLEIQN